MSFTYLYTTIGDVYGSPSNGNYLVGPGVEIPSGICCSFEGSLDISDANLLVDFHSTSSYTPASFNGFRISDVFGTIAPFTGASVNVATNMAGFDASRVTFDADNVWVNWQSLLFDPNTIVSIDINGGSVPEPATFGLLGLGLLAVAVRRRTRG